MGGLLTKGLIGKEDLEIQENTNATETFDRTSSTGGITTLSKIPDIWGGLGKINVAEIASGDVTAEDTVVDSIKTKSPWIDVTHPDYGAVGDGVTDDTTAIQAAVNAATALYVSSGNQQTIFFPPGRYAFTDTTGITLYDGVRFLGADPTASIFVDNDATALPVERRLFKFYQIDGSALDNVTFENLGFYGNERYQAAYFGYGAAIWANVVNNFKVINCHFKDWMCGSVCIGTSTHAQSQNVLMQGCKIWSSTTYPYVGFYASNCKDLKILFNDFSHISRAISLENVTGETYLLQNILILGNVVRSGNVSEISATNHYAGIQVDYDNDIVGYCDNLNIIGNQFFDSLESHAQAADIYLASEDVADNHFRGVNISDNQFYNSYSNGIALTKLDCASIHHNSFLYPNALGQQTGIVLATTRYSDLSNNIFRGTFANDIQEGSDCVTNQFSFNKVSGTGNGIVKTAGSGSTVWGEYYSTHPELELSSYNTRGQLRSAKDFYLYTPNAAGTMTNRLLIKAEADTARVICVQGIGTGEYAAGDVTATAKTYKIAIYAEDGTTLLGYLQVYAGA